VAARLLELVILLSALVGCGHEQPHALDTPPGPAWTVPGVGRSVGPAGDVNGDGFDDFWISHQNHDGPRGGAAGRVEVWAGGGDGPSEQPISVIDGSSLDRLGRVAAAAGDVDSDGFDDLVVGVPLSHHEPRVRLLRGSPAGLVPWQENQAGAPWFGDALGAGDMNRDGFADLVVGSPAEGDWTGRAALYRGSMTGLARAPSWEVRGGAPETLTGYAVAMGDVDHDGYADLALAFRNHDGPAGPDTGKVEVYRGSIYGLQPTPEDVMHSPGSTWFGRQVALADVDCDQRDDLLALASVDPGHVGGISAWLTGATGDLSGAPWNVHRPCTSEGCPTQMAVVGDLNGDRYQDFVYQQWGGAGAPEQAFTRLFFGGPDGPRAAWLLEGPDARWLLAGVGDLDGDGYDDLAGIPPGCGERPDIDLWRGGPSGPILPEGAVAP
jgi:hypothetical protein